MKQLIAPLVLVVATASAQQTAPDVTLKSGSEVKIEAVSTAKWIQGEPLKSFEPGKVYILECWATWCGPCVAAIPHVNELHKKYHDKGLRVIGMNVWEDGEEKVAKFVKGRGDGMSYPVAYTGKGSDFENDWLKAAGVRGIPRAFVVKDGRLLFHTHPNSLTDGVVEELLAGDEGIKKAAAQITAGDEAQARISTLLGDFRKAIAAKDTETMAAKIAEMEKIETASRFLQAMKLDLLVAKKDWAGATRMLEETSADADGGQISVMTMASKISMGAITDCPEEFVAAVAKIYGTMMNEPGSRSDPMGQVTLATLQWKAGQNDAAVATARKSAEDAGKQSGERKMPAEPFERFAKAVEDGTLPAMSEFYGWLRASMEKSDGMVTPAKPVKP